MSAEVILEGSGEILFETLDNTFQLSMDDEIAIDNGAELILYKVEHTHVECLFIPGKATQHYVYTVSLVV